MKGTPRIQKSCFSNKYVIEVLSQSVVPCTGPLVCLLTLYSSAQPEVFHMHLLHLVIDCSDFKEIRFCSMKIWKTWSDGCPHHHPEFSPYTSLVCLNAAQLLLRQSFSRQDAADWGQMRWVWHLALAIHRDAVVERGDPGDGGWNPGVRVAGGLQRIGLALIWAWFRPAWGGKVDGGMWWYSGELLCFKSFPWSLPWCASVLSSLSHWQNNTECSSPKGRVQFLEASLAFTASSELFKASVCFLEPNWEFFYNIL